MNSSATHINRRCLRKDLTENILPTLARHQGWTEQLRLFFVDYYLGRLDHPFSCRLPYFIVCSCHVIVERGCFLKNSERRGSVCGLARSCAHLLDI